MTNNNPGKDWSRRWPNSQQIACAQQAMANQQALYRERMNAMLDIELGLG
jgi:hypothetical protein